MSGDVGGMRRGERRRVAAEVSSCSFFVATSFPPLPTSPSPLFLAPRQRLSPLSSQTNAVCKCTALCCSMLSLLRDTPIS